MVILVFAVGLLETPGLFDSMLRARNEYEPRLTQHRQISSPLIATPHKHA